MTQITCDKCGGVKGYFFLNSAARTEGAPVTYFKQIKPPLVTQAASIAVTAPTTATLVNVRACSCPSPQPSI